MTYTEQYLKLWDIVQRVSATLNTLTSPQEIKEEGERACSKDIPHMLAHIGSLSPEDREKIIQEVPKVKRAIHNLCARALGTT